MASENNHACGIYKKTWRTTPNILFVGELFHDSGEHLSAEIKEAAREALAVLVESPTKQARVPVKARIPVPTR